MSPSLPGPVKTKFFEKNLRAHRKLRGVIMMGLFYTSWPQAIEETETIMGKIITEFTRRDFVQYSAGSASLLAALHTVPGLMAEMSDEILTPTQTEGPFYPDKLPLDTDNDLLDNGIVPIVNENDAISEHEDTDENVMASFDDNDKLSSLISVKLEADLLLVLTNVDGVYTDNPFDNPDAQQLHHIHDLKELEAIKTDGTSQAGRGGMASKLNASQLAAMGGVRSLITSGYRAEAISLVFDEEASDWYGTLIEPLEGTGRWSGIKRWIGLSSGSQGVVIVNQGAYEALKKRGASLLAIGIIDVQGQFAEGQVVTLHTQDGTEFGRGVSYYSSNDLRRLAGHPSSEFKDVLSDETLEHNVAIHRNQLVVFDEPLHEQPSENHPS